MISGMLKAYPEKITELECGSVLVRRNKKEGKVALISGAASFSYLLEAISENIK